MFQHLRRLVPFELRAEYFRTRRRLSNCFDRRPFAAVKLSDLSRFPHLVFSHRSTLIRDYPEPWRSLQQGKVKNLSLAAACIDRLVIAPHTFVSFWKLVGRPSAAKGYTLGMGMQDKKLTASVGGGLCQLSNALYWTALHLGFDIAERHRHSYDLFPDQNRTLPFGAGATVFFNYRDFAVYNPLPESYVFCISLDAAFLNISAYSDVKPEFTYRITEELHRFERRGSDTYRMNELHRIKQDAAGRAIEKSLVCRNEGLVLYER